MLIELLQNLKSEPRSMKIYGKSLLYNIDLTTRVHSIGSELVFNTSGAIRVGPLKSSGSFYSKYTVIEDSFRISSIEVDFPRINFRESYLRENGELLFSNGKDDRILVDESKGPVYDPQPLLFKMVMLNQNEEVDFSDILLLSGKLKPYQFQCSENKLKMKMAGRTLFQGRINNSIDVEIPKFKIKVKVEST